MLKESFARFTEEHYKVVQDIPSDLYADQERIFCITENEYHTAIIKLRSRVAELETIECVHRTETNETTHVKTHEKTETPKRTPRRYFVEEAMVIDHSQPDSSSDERSFNETGQLPSQVGAAETSGLRQDLREHLNRQRAEATNTTERAEASGRTETNAGRSMLMHMSNTTGSAETNESPTLVCNNCTRNHPMFKCIRFLRLSIPERHIRVKRLDVCRNCFAPMYLERGPHRCRAGSCRRCGRKTVCSCCAQTVCCAQQQDANYD